jgi:hypothetical protein
LPWLCVDDFNEVLHAKEQIGGNDHEEWWMDFVKLLSIAVSLIWGSGAYHSPGITGERPRRTSKYD